jgi:hypothetical protein
LKRPLSSKASIHPWKAPETKEKPKKQSAKETPLPEGIKFLRIASRLDRLPKLVITPTTACKRWPAAVPLEETPYLET